MTSLEAPPSVSATRLRFALVRLTRTLRRDSKQTLSPSLISALAAIEDVGPMRISALAIYEAVDPSVATRVVASLESQGLFERREDPDDKRASLIDLTDAGRALLTQLWSERTLGISTRLERLSRNERAAIDAALPVLEKIARDN